jgi:hypothetical protein
MYLLALYFEVCEDFSVLELASVRN